VIGHGGDVSPDLAAFANAVMVRTYDWNDGMQAKGGGHPSDMIPAMIAVGETIHATGEQLIEAIVLAYELLGALGNVAPTRAKGFDQGTFMGLSAALAAARMLGMSADQMANAVSLTLVPHVPLRVTRTGKLSMWKGAATASAMHSALVATRLAKHGMTGPAEPFEGTSGLWEQAVGPFDVALPAQAGGPMVVEISHLKQFPAETHSQALLGLIPRVREFAKSDEIESIEIETYWQAYHEIAMHPSKWDPDTRETADHSLPYLLAVALVDGTVTPASFTEDRIADQSLRPLMGKITVREDKAFTEGFRPGGQSISGVPRARLIVTRTGGEKFVEEVGFHKGHAKNPLSRSDIDAKFDSASEGVITPDVRDRIRAAAWGIGDSDDITKPMNVIGDWGLQK
jgi:2-methylcitrate dehydratase